MDAGVHEISLLNTPFSIIIIIFFFKFILLQKKKQTKTKTEKKRETPVLKYKLCNLWYHCL